MPSSVRNAAFCQMFAFVSPVSATGLRTGATRRALTSPVRPASAARSTPTMKKVRRGAVEDDSNAVDVFGGASLSQEELLADALGPDPTEQPVQKPKKKKKGKKGAVEDEDGNAVDVFASPDMSQEDLLAAALGDDEPPAPVPNSSRKKKKGKKGAVEDEDANAVDVFADPAMSQEDLLASALDEDDSAAPPPAQKKKKKKGKKGTVIEEDNAVDVFGGADMSQEDLLADALGTSEGVSPEPAVREKKNKKGKRGKIIDDDENAVDVFGGAGLSPEELLGQAMEDSVKETIDDVTSTSAGNGVAKVMEDESTIIDVEEEQEVTPVSGKEDVVEKEDDDFEIEADVVTEFEETSKEFESFTAVGRRAKTRSKRKERNEAESRFTDPRRASFGTGGEKFSSVRLEDVTVTFRNTTILNGITWGVKTGDRVGLIGENGCGKTTQLKLIAGLMEPSSGEVLRSSKKTKASFLRQEFIDELDPTRTLREEFFSSFKEEGEALMAYKKCEVGIGAAGEDMEKLEEMLNRMEELRQKCDDLDAWNLDSRIDKVMPGLGFIEEDNDKLVASFSGGWKVRIGLGKVLLQDPDLLLLDEPSNHLDNESVEWLEEYLQTCKLPMVVVSHDREFLDRVCTKIVDIEGGEAFEYPGNYTTFVKLKKEQRGAWEAAYERQQKFVKEQINFIKRNRRNPARSSQVKSREKMLERMERTGQMVRRPPRQGKPLVFRFPPAPRSGRDCVIVDDVRHSYGEKVLFDGASIAIERGDRIALIGPNGCGKSTLLKMITGYETPQEGNVQCKELTNVSLAYYEQNQADALDLDVSVLETLKQAAPSTMAYEEIRAILGKFLFKGDDVEKKVESLSGGEKARLALAKIMMEPSNVLVLDEPGNHLSISAKEMLEEALQNFDGTLLMVSHDRYLISQVATQILSVENHQLVLHDGDYKSFMETDKNLKEKLQARFIPGVAEIKSAPKVMIEEAPEEFEKKTKRKKNFGGSGVVSGKTKEMNAKRWNRR